MTDERGDALRGALGRVEGRTAALRLVVALDAHDGDSVAAAARRYGVPERTAYDWVDRFEGVPADPESLAGAARDAPRPGRPSELDTSERRRLRAALSAPPSNADLGGEEWTPALVSRYVARTFGVDYSRRHARRLLSTLR